MDTAAGKKEIRGQLLQKRKALSQTEREGNSQKIAETVLASPLFSNASVVHCYLSDATEVQTDAIIKEALRQGKRVVVPTLSMQPLSEINDLSPAHFQMNRYGIREPIGPFQKKVEKNRVDLFILPGVAYDTMGRRIGQGGGYYDRLLADLSVATIGLAFEFQILEDLPESPSDRRVDCIVTEKRTIICGEKE